MSTATLTASPASQLSAEQLAQFNELGYVVLPAFLPAEEIARLKVEVDQWKQITKGGPNPYAEHKPGEKVAGPMQIELPEHGKLISHPALMPLIEQLMGPGFAYHHLHTARHDAGMQGVNWHHDYEQHPQTNRSHCMVHVFYYLNGLDGTIGDLMVLPRSQRLLSDRNLGIFGQGELPGTVVIDDLPPGSAVIVHSAVWHARRAKPGGEGRPRYFIDASYCQAGIRWPGAYPWWRQMLARAMELGLHRDGRHAHLFDPAHFYDTTSVMQRFQPLNVGSLSHRLVGDA
jgi:ectoine hydroxylase-related dioxygenase (phytanoyl-CoA dioxygenase family)